MTKPGKDDKLEFRKVDLSKWVARHFVSYFYEKIAEIYGQDKIERNYDKDCMLAKRLLFFFEKNQKSREDFIKYINWSVDKYSKSSTAALPMLFGILNNYTKDYMNVELTAKKPKKRRTTPLLSKEMKEWIESEKKRTKPNVHE